MLRGRIHSVFAVLFLIWFGLSNTMLACGLVVCHDGHGGSQIEWGCDRNSSGECASTCGDEGDDEDERVPHPCEDTPIQGGEQIAKVAPRQTGATGIALPAMLAIIALWSDVPERPRVVLTHAGPDRPPDVLRHIRTVVLIV